jgi:hypothetical protein
MSRGFRVKDINMYQPLLFNNFEPGAVFSDDRKYRYALYRGWGDIKEPKVMYIGLNPSTANEEKNDNTITKLIKISKYNGFGGMYMLNLFAIISAHPAILKTDPDPIGDNDGWLEKIAPKCEKIVFAWGNFKEAEQRAKEVIQMFEDPYCLFINKNGSPKHPLYCKDETEIIPYKP